MIYMLRNMKKVNTFFFNYDHPPRENSQRKKQKLPILAKGGEGGGVTPYW